MTLAGETCNKFNSYPLHENKNNYYNNNNKQ